jgi:hypothetical protein
MFPVAQHAWHEPSPRSLCASPALAAAPREPTSPEPWPPAFRSVAASRAASTASRRATESTRPPRVSGPRRSPWRHSTATTILPFAAFDSMSLRASGSFSSGKTLAARSVSAPLLDPQVEDVVQVSGLHWQRGPGVPSDLCVSGPIDGGAAGGALLRSRDVGLRSMSASLRQS